MCKWKMSNVLTALQNFISMTSSKWNILHINFQLKKKKKQDKMYALATLMYYLIHVSIKIHVTSLFINILVSATCTPHRAYGNHRSHICHLL